MAYRDDEAARRLRRDAIERELDGVRRELDAFDSLTARRDALEAELESTFRSGAADRRRHLPLLPRLTVKSPCKEPWTAMRGDDRVRHCARCDKDVFDLSSLSREEAESLLASSRGDLCVRYFVRPDGTVMTSECGPGRRTRRFRGLGLALGVGAAATAAALSYAEAEQEVMGQMVAVQGEPAFVPPTTNPDPTSPDRHESK